MIIGLLVITFDLKSCDAAFGRRDLNLDFKRLYIKCSPASTSVDMAASSSQNGIQHLLTAEQEAQRIVNAAKTAKQARLKQAKEEAERKLLSSVLKWKPTFRGSWQSGDSGANVKRLEQETEAKIHHLKIEASRISPDVVSMLLRHVTTVKN
ncbi:V-type proton ATPase subunit G 1 [Sesamum angolense]|uniref:V-type proton ATPase subunit G 1 n=1 Tax=Sesamum angolense TaxID=2727404 RepID=A0AAE1X2K6_9LAMI|nr:V-type proton ATPase subunit G 1 [Sesamum angolense]